MLTKLYGDTLEAFYQELNARGKSTVWPIPMGATEFTLFGELLGDQLEQRIPFTMQDVLTDMRDQLAHGDAKYGPHPGPKRAFGALRNEFNELMTELDAEDASVTSVHKEAIQVLAMAYKFIRDYTLPAMHAIAMEEERRAHASAHPETKTSADWLTSMKPGLRILDPDGWDRTNFHWSFNVEEVTLDEFLARVKLSSIGATQEWQDKYLK